MAKKDRLANNAASKQRAERDGEPWESYEVELLMEWDGTDYQLWELAELLERTIEACRQRFYVARRGEVEVTTTTTVTTTYHGWVEGDKWWD